MDADVMTPDERARLEAAEAGLAEVRLIMPDLIAAGHAQSAQSGEQTAQAAAFDREISRLGRAIDYPEHLDALRARVTESVRRQDLSDARAVAAPAGSPDWHDNAERGLGALLGSTPGRVLAATVFVLVAGFVVVLGILAYKGDLGAVMRGTFTTGTEISVTPTEPAPDSADVASAPAPDAP